MKHVAWEPCPACQEPVHPVAGRCKHCKADLLTLRAEAAAARKRQAAEARAAAATPLRVASDPHVATKVPSKDATDRSTRRLLLIAAAVLALGVAGGVTAQKLYARSAVPAASAVKHAIDVDAPAAPSPPHDFADPFAPLADPNDPRQRQGSGSIDPNDPFGGSDPFEMMRRFMQNMPLDPGAPFDPNDPNGASPFGPGAPHSRRAPRSPGAPTPDVRDVQLFLPAVVEVACGKLAECGVLDAPSAGVCQMMGSAIGDDDTVARVQRGECHYDAAAARQCLEALGGMSCDSAADPGLLLGFTDRIAPCSRTLDCPGP
jgi:hypothetical protein